MIQHGIDRIVRNVLGDHFFHFRDNRHLIKSTRNGEQKIKELLKELTDVEDPVQLRSVTAKIREAVCAEEMPAELAESIRKGYRELAEKVGEPEPDLDH